MTRRCSRKARALLVILMVIGRGFAAELREDDVQVRVRCLPAAAQPQVTRQLTPAHGGGQDLTVTITNSSRRDLMLQELALEFPWDQGERLLCSGGYDQSRPGARVHAAGATIESGAFLMSHRPGDANLVGFVTWRTFVSHLRHARGRVTVSADGENRLVKPGATVSLEKLWLAHAANWQDLLFSYADEIARENQIRLKPFRPYVGWATWDYFGGGWSSQQVTENLARLKEIYPAANLLQIDGGWWPLRGDYTTWRASLNPGGMPALARAIRARGLTAGIHLDVMRVDADAKIAQAHPEYFLHNERGAMVTDGRRIFFDYSQPGARAYMTRALAAIRGDWGFDYFKFDFLRYGLNELVYTVADSPDGRPAIVPHDASLTSVERLRAALAAFRAGVGADAFVLGCSAVHGPLFGLVDGLRTGNDIQPNFARVRSTMLDNVGNFHLHGKVVYNDADYLVLRAKEDQDQSLTRSAVKSGTLTLNEAEMWAHYVGLFGGTKLESDNLPTLREERRALFRHAAALPTADRFVPIDLWQHARSDDDPPSVVVGAAGTEVFLAIFNWTDGPKTSRLRGLPDVSRPLVEMGGTGVWIREENAVKVTLEPRRSMIFRVSLADFDTLRRNLSVE